MKCFVTGRLPGSRKPSRLSPDMPKNLLFILGSVVLSASMWLWVQDVAIAHQQKEAAELGIPRGNLSDLYPRWLGAREFLFRGRDPYRDDITREIQAGYYGRAIDASRPNDPKDQQAFAYPLYVVFVLAPTIGLPFAMVQKIFLWLLVMLTAASIPLWLLVVRWRLPATAQLVWIILVVGCFPAIQGFKLQQLTLLVAALLAACMAAIAYRKFALAGVLLAVASIKPQLVLLLVFWLIVWIGGHWKERQRLFWSFGLSMAALFGASERLMPGWLQEFRAATGAYYRYTGGGRSVLDAALTPVLGRSVSVILVVVLLIFLWQFRHAEQGTGAFQWSLSAVLATTLVIIPMFAPYNQMLLVPGVMLSVRTIHSLWEKGRLSRFFVLMAASSLAWPWLAAVSLVVALLFLPSTIVERAWALPLYTTWMTPVSVLALLLMGRRVFCRERRPAP